MGAWLRAPHGFGKARLRGWQWLLLYVLTFVAAALLAAAAGVVFQVVVGPLMVQQATAWSSIEFTHVTSQLPYLVEPADGSAPYWEMQTRVQGVIRGPGYTFPGRISSYEMSIYCEGVLVGTTTLAVQDLQAGWQSSTYFDKDSTFRVASVEGWSTMARHLTDDAELTQELEGTAAVELFPSWPFAMVFRGVSMRKTVTQRALNLFRD